eukprot:g7520.t1
MALSALRTAGRALAAGGEQPSRDTLVAALSSDLEGPRRGQALHGLCDMLGDPGSRAAVAQVLDSVSWELFGLVMGCLKHSTASSRIGGNGSSTASDGDKLSTAAVGSPPQAAETAALAEKLALELAEIFSPKELHIMALEHLHAYSERRTVGTVLAVLRRSTERMPPTRRARFLEAALQPALKATKRVAEEGDDVGSSRQRRLQDPSSGSDDGGDDDGEVCHGGDYERGAAASSSSLPPPPVAAELEMASQAAYEAAARAAETAIEFVGPLVEQACAERGKLGRGPKKKRAREAGRGGEGRPPGGGRLAGAKESGAVDGPVGWSGEDMSASDLSLAAYLGFALSALELAGEASACIASASSAASAAGSTASGSAAAAASSAASAVAVGAPSARLPPSEEESVEALAKAEERLVGLIIGGPVASPFDLRFVLLHGYRLSYADRVKRRRADEGGDDGADGEERVPGRGKGRGRSSLSAVGGGGLVGLAEAAVGGALPWTLGGVSTVAYLVACRPNLREKWLPLVWSRQTERRLLLPHSEVLMRSKSKRVAYKGLELACFVAENLGPFPDQTGAFAFEWERKDDGVGAWGFGERDEEANAAAAAAAAAATTTTTPTNHGPEEARPTLRRKPVDSHRFDLVAFLQVLVDVMVSCPLHSLRARGHAALSALLGATGEASRFRVLERLVERCPWPNATGLLFDFFRREVDRALRQHRGKVEAGEEEEERLQVDGQGGGPRDDLPQRSPTSETAATASVGVSAPGRGSPFASALAGDFVSAQLRRACRGGPPASIMMDMDSRTGAITLARYALALDVDRQEAGAGGRLKLREPEKLRENRRLVRGFLDELRGAAVTADTAGPEHFRLFILEDAAQQCLDELQR